MTGQPTKDTGYQDVGVSDRDKSILSYHPLRVEQTLHEVID